MAIYENITRKEYCKLPGINASSLKHYYESSLNGNYESSKDREETEAMRFGTACHAMVLENDKFMDTYRQLDYPINPKTKKAYGADTKAVKEYIATLPKDKKYLSVEQYAILNDISENLNNNQYAMQILNSCPKRETAVTWVDNESGIPCKALIDFMGDKIVGDLKTIRDIKFKLDIIAMSKAMMWHLAGTGDLLQFAFYMDGCLAPENNLEVEKFAVIFAKNNGNCDVLPAFLSDDTLEFGRKMYSRAMLNYANRADNKAAYNIIEI